MPCMHQPGGRCEGFGRIHRIQRRKEGAQPGSFCQIRQTTGEMMRHALGVPFVPSVAEPGPPPGSNSRLFPCTSCSCRDCHIHQTCDNASRHLPACDCRSPVMNFGQSQVCSNLSSNDYLRLISSTPFGILETLSA